MVSLVDRRNLQAVDADGSGLDAFGRRRVSNPETLIGVKQIFDKLPLIFDDQEVSGSDTSSTYNKPNAGTRIGVSTAAGKRVRQTFMRFNYEEGKSQEIAMTGILGAGAVGITQEYGLVDDDNGVFFTCIDGIVYVAVRSSTTGSALVTKFAQADWNMEKMDGKQDRGVEIDFSKAQQFIFDFEWLGIGRVRLGFKIKGVRRYVHEFDFSNNQPGVYMSTPNLPMRYSIQNDGTGPASTMDHNCVTVISEGGQQHTGIRRMISTAGTTVVMADENQLYAILGIRLKSTHLGATIEMVKVSVVLQSASDDIEWSLIHNPTVAGSPSFTEQTNSAIEYYIGGLTNLVTDNTGVAFDGGYAATSAGQSASDVDDSAPEDALRLGSAIDGTPDTIVLCGRPINGSSTGVNVEGLIVLRELS